MIIPQSHHNEQSQYNYIELGHNSDESLILVLIPVRVHISPGHCGRSHEYCLDTERNVCSSTHCDLHSSVSQSSEGKCCIIKL